jgi:small subunit ribosomal protein S16
LFLLFRCARCVLCEGLAGGGLACQGTATYEIITTCPQYQGFTAGKDNQVQVLMIRLARIGARKQPYYRVVVIDKERARNGRSVEVVGLYNPRTNPATIDLKRERITYWVSKGAQLSDTVNRLLSKAPAPTGTAA